MNNILEQKKKEFSTTNSRRKIWQRIVSGLAAVVVFATTYSLILPAITKDKTFCGHEEHKHSLEEGCYEERRYLICGQEEGHIHTDACYEVQKELLCSLQDCETHTHTEACVEQRQTLICTLTENKMHIHTPDCLDTEGNFVCQYTEAANEGHRHMTAGENEHGLSCFDENGSLICMLQEKEAHLHTDECYKMEYVNICGLEEKEGHNSNCFGEEQRVLTCNQEESADAHVHTEDCYITELVLVCTKEEHEHTIACYSDPNADLENSEIWSRSFAHVKLTGVWAEDVLAIADSQLGYRESVNNYFVNEEDGIIKGYTRYGAWYGCPYGDWCAMFASFCLNYAQVDRSLMPIEAGCQRWIDKLAELGIYRPTGNGDDKTAPGYVPPAPYEPKLGDLIFFNWNKFPDADHVGIVYELIKDADGNITDVKTIEGNNGGRVACHTYPVSDRGILGYGELPENPNSPQQCSCSAAEGEAHKEDCPLFKPVNVPQNENTITLTAVTEDSVTVVMTAPADAFDFPPEELTLSVTPIEDEEMKALIEESAVQPDTENAKRHTVIFDIKVLHNGEELQPKKPVTVVFSGINAPDAEVFHVNESNNTADNMNAATDDEGNIIIEADGFSPYGVTWFVEFQYDGNWIFRIPGDGSVMLSRLFTLYFINRNIADVVECVFSDPSLLEVQQISNDWKLTPLQAFDTEETLTVTFNDSEVYLFGITAIPIYKGTAAQKVIVGSSDWNFASSLPMTSVVIDVSKVNLSNAVIEDNAGTDLQIGNFASFGASRKVLYFTVEPVLGYGQTYDISGPLSVRFIDAAILPDGSRSDIIQSWSNISYKNGGWHPINNPSFKYLTVATDGHGGVGLGELPFLIDMPLVGFDEAGENFTLELRGDINISVEGAASDDTYMVFIQDLDRHVGPLVRDNFETIFNISNAASKLAISGDSVLRFESTDADYLANGLTVEPIEDIPENPYTQQNSFTYLSYANSVNFDFTSPKSRSASSYGEMASIGAKPQYKAYQADGSLSDWVVGNAGGNISYTDLSVSPNETVQWDNIVTKAYELRGAAFGKKLRVDFEASEGYYAERLTQTVHNTVSELPVESGTVQIDSIQDHLLYDAYFLPIKGCITINKRAADTGLPQSGAVFMLTGTSSVHGAFELTSIDNGDGTYTIMNVPYGLETDIYTLKETKAPFGYAVMEDITISGDNFNSNGVNVTYNVQDHLSAERQTLFVIKTVANTINADNTYFPFAVELKNGENIIPFDTNPFLTVKVTDENGVDVTATDAANLAVVRGSTSLTLNLKHGYKLSVANIPTGCTATVTETANPHYTTTYSTDGGATSEAGTQAVVEMLADKEVAFTNTRAVANLTVSKLAQDGNTQDFNFTVLLTDGNGNPLKIPADTATPQRYTVDNVSPYAVNFSLKNGESVMLMNVPTGSKAKLTENNPEGYSVTISDITQGEIVISHTNTAENIIIEADKSLRVLNNPGVELPSTGGSGTHLFIFGGLALICGALIFGFCLRRKREVRTFY